MKKLAAAACLLAVYILGLSACAGVPLRSMPRLLTLQSALMEGNPADLMLAVQMDVRMLPPAGAIPTLDVKFVPNEGSTVKAVDRHFPMRATTVSTAALGLPAPDRGRHWLVYSLTPESQRDIAELREQFKRQRTENTGKKGGTLSIGIEQSGLAVRDPAFARSEWESWLQVARAEGFFKIWSGTVADLMKQK